MSVWMWILLIPLGVGLGVCLLVIGAGTVLVLDLSKMRFRRVAEEQLSAVVVELAATSIDPTWLEEHGFKWYGVLHMQSQLTTTYAASWVNDNINTFVCAYFGSVLGETIRSTDIATVFEPQIGLTTADAKQSSLFPSEPGTFKQYLPERSLEERWHAHMVAFDLICQIQRPESYRLRSLEREMSEAVESELQAVRRRFLWPLRIPWWYFIRRKLHDSKTVEQMVAEFEQRPRRVRGIDGG